LASITHDPTPVNDTIVDLIEHTPAPLEPSIVNTTGLPEPPPVAAGV
jgi:hypothetical protein